MNGVSTIELLARMTGSLLVIGGLLWLVQRIGRRRMGNFGRSAVAAIEITSRKQLTKSSSIALVRAGERHLLIGVSDSGVSLLAEGDDLAIEPTSADIEAGASSGSTSSARSALPSVLTFVRGLGEKVATARQKPAAKMTPSASTNSGSAIPDVTALTSNEPAAHDLRNSVRNIDAHRMTFPGSSSHDTASNSTTSNSTTSDDTISDDTISDNTTSSSDAARKPHHEGRDSTHSRTSALDALREMTVRRT